MCKYTGSGFIPLLVRGNIDEANEFLVLMKSHMSLFKSLSKKVEEIHSYPGARKHSASHNRGFTVLSRRGKCCSSTGEE